MHRFARSATCVAALLATTVAVAACGTGSSHPSSSPDSGVIPKDALAVAVVDTRESDSSPRGRLLADLGRVPAFALATNGKIPTNASLVRSLVEAADDDHKVTYKRDIKPWLGDHLGAALLDVNEKKGGEDVAYILFADSTDDDKAVTGMKRIFGDHASGSAHGTKIMWGEPDGSRGTRNYWAVSHGHVVASLHRADVVAALDALDRPAARPGAPRDRLRRRVGEAAAGREVGDPRRDHQRADDHAVDRSARVVGRLAEAVAARVLIAGERLGQHRDAREPLDVGHPVPAGDDEPQRVAVLRRQRPAVQGVGEQHLVAHRLGERKRALVVLLHVALDTAVEPGEDDLHRVVGDTGLLEQRA
jgi:hypothetical protein